MHQYFPPPMLKFTHSLLFYTCITQHLWLVAVLTICAPKSTRSKESIHNHLFGLVSKCQKWLLMYFSALFGCVRRPNCSQPTKTFSVRSMIFKIQNISSQVLRRFFTGRHHQHRWEVFRPSYVVTAKTHFLLSMKIYSLTGNVMTLKFISDASVTAGGFQLKYNAIDASKLPQNYSHYFNWAHWGKLKHSSCGLDLFFFVFVFLFSLFTKFKEATKLLLVLALLFIFNHYNCFHPWAHPNVFAACQTTF